MKKSFFYLTLIAAMAMTFVSCSNDEEKDTDENRLNFANQLTQNSTSCTWEGYDQYQRKELGNWVDEDRKSYVVIRFDRASTTAANGTGMLLTFENSYKEQFKEASEFIWGFDKGQLQITYRHGGWAPVYAEYYTNELTISGDTFKGWWWEKTDRRFEFKYTKSSFKDWDKYVN